MVAAPLALFCFFFGFGWLSWLLSWLCLKVSKLIFRISSAWEASLPSLGLGDVPEALLSSETFFLKCLSRSTYLSLTERCVTRNTGSLDLQRWQAIFPQTSPLSTLPFLCFQGWNWKISLRKNMSWALVHFMAWLYGKSIKMMSKGDMSLKKTVVLRWWAAGTKHRSQVIVLLTQKVSQTPLKANLRPNKFLFRPN